MTVQARPVIAEGAEEHRWEDLANWTPVQNHATEMADNFGYFLFGGARGPGKSHWLRWYCIRFLLLCYQYYGLSNVRVMLASESYPTLRDRQISKIEVEFPDWLGYYFSSQSEFRLRSNFGNGVLCLRNLDDTKKYGSAEFALIAVDELTENMYGVFNDLRGCLRWPGFEYSKFVAATNPTGKGAQWVRKLWIESDFPDEIIDAGVQHEFAFLQGLPTDNPFLTQRYWQMLRGLPPILRRAWVEGDWYAGIEGQVYPSFTPENVTVEAEYHPDKGPIYWAIDEGFTQDHPRVVLLCQIPEVNTYHWFYEYYVSYEVGESSIKTVLQTAGYPKPTLATVDPSEAELLPRLWAHGIDTARPRHGVEQGIQRMQHVIEGHDGVRRFLVHPRCKTFVQEMKSYARDKFDRVVKANDHGPDGARYLVWHTYRVQDAEEPEEEQEQEATPGPARGGAGETSQPEPERKPKPKAKAKPKAKPLKDAPPPPPRRGPVGPPPAVAPPGGKKG